jgi:hypothetical protein
LVKLLQVCLKHPHNMEVMKVEYSSDKEMDPPSSDCEFEPRIIDDCHHSEHITLPTFHAVKIEFRVRCI